MGSRGHKYRLKPLPIGNKLKKKDIKKIAKREKYNAKDIITVDNVEDPYGIKHPDHYVREQQNFAMDNQKELLCTGNTWRVSWNKKSEIEKSDSDPQLHVMNEWILSDDILMFAFWMQQKQRT